MSKVAVLFAFLSYLGSEGTLWAGVEAPGAAMNADEIKRNALLMQFDELEYRATMETAYPAVLGLLGMGGAVGFSLMKREDFYNEPSWDLRPTGPC